MDIDRIVAEIGQRLEGAGTAERRAHAVGYFPTAERVLGTAVPDMRVVVREVGKRLKGESPDDVLSLAYALIDDRTFEGRQAAYELVARHKPSLAAVRIEEVERLGTGIDNWACVDAFACLIAGPAWREHQVDDEAVKRWARSGDLWCRRAAIVSTVALNMKSRGGTGDTPRTLLICELVAADHEDMVAKGLSWALRELVERDRQAVSNFLDRHDAALAARVKREVGNKLRTGLKTPRRSR